MTNINKPMELEVLVGDWGLPSIDLKSLEALAFVRFSGASVNIIKKNNPFWTPNGSFPVFKHGKQCLTDINSISEYLKKKNFSPDFALNTKQTAEVVACTSMLREQLYPALEYIWWVDKKNYVGLSRPWYGKNLAWPWNFYYPRSYKKRAAVYFESVFPSAENVISSQVVESEVYSAAEKCLTALSIRLGESEFFFGSHPTSLDAVVYSYLAPLIKAPFPSNVLQNHAKACTNLLKFVNTITNRYFLQDVKGYEKKQKHAEENRSKEEQFKMRDNILAGVIAVFLMSLYAVKTGLLKVTDGVEIPSNLFDGDEEAKGEDRNY